MVVRGLGRILSAAFDAMFRPSEFVAAERRVYTTNRASAISHFRSLITVYLTNLALYAGPLTLAGFGVGSTVDPPPRVVALLAEPLGDPITVWQLLLAFFQNSAYITALTVVTIITFHLGAFLTFNSRGAIQSVHTVVYTSTAYLAGLFTLAWYLATNPNVPAAREFVLNLQREFVFIVLDFLGVSLTLPGGRPESIAMGEFTRQGIFLIVLLVLMTVYYLYSLYLGARINHRMRRGNALVTLVIVATSPVLYIIGSVTVTMLSGGI